MSVRYEETKYGFIYGAAIVQRTCSDDKKGWVYIDVSSPRDAVSIYVTKTGKIRVYRRGVEMLGNMEVEK